MKLAEIERDSIYLFEHYLRNRIPTHLREELKSLNDVGRALMIRDHILEKIATQTRSSIGYFAKRVSEIDPVDWSRIPSTLRFPVTGEKSLSGFIDESIQKGRIDSDLISELRPHSIFAICAGIFLAINDRFRTRQHAIRYANLCLTDCRSLRAEGRNDLLREAVFLCALTTRFLLGDAPDLVTAEGHFRSAIRFLEEAEAEIGTTHDLADRVRIDAERAAALLFMAAHRFKANATKIGHYQIAEAEQLLVKCRLAMGGLYRNEFESHPEIRRHYSHNIAAVHVLKSLAIPEYAVPRDDELVKSVGVMVKKSEQDKKSSLFLVAELRYFLALVDDARTKDAKESFQRFKDSNAPVLHVDRWQVDEMCRKLGIQD